MTLYDTIGVEKTASKEEIKKAYREKAKQSHPDKGGDDKAMSELTFAYKILINEDSRNLYDTTGQTKKMDFEQLFQQFIVNFIVPVVENEPNLQTVDVLKKSKELALNTILAINGEIKKDEKRLDKIVKFLNRLKLKQGSVNRIADFMKIQKAGLEQNIQSHKLNIDSINKGLEHLKEYGYDFENETIINKGNRFNSYADNGLSGLGNAIFGGPII